MTSILHTKSLTIGYKVPLFEDLSLEFPSSQLTCLMGRNGAGKSTIIKTLSGLLRPLSGDVYINDEKLVNLSESDISKKMGLVLTHSETVAYMSVFELVSFGRYPYTNSRGTLSETDIKYIDDSLKIVEIEHLKDRYVAELSDGERQKAEIARVLAQQTDIIILDEPVAFLDFPAKIELMYLLQNLAHEKQKTIIISTHDIEMALSIADNLLVIDNQKNIISGTPSKLVENGSISQIFDTTNVTFENSTKRFVYKQ